MQMLPYSYVQFAKCANIVRQLTGDTGLEEAAEAIAEYAGVDPTELNGSAAQQLIDALLPAARKLAFSILICAVIFFIGTRVISLVLKAIDKSMEKTKVEVGAARFLHSVLKTALYVILLFIIAAQLGVNTASIFAILGTAGLAVAMSLQGSLSNVAGGILILLTRPFRVGDYICTNYGEGKVTMIGMVYTSLTTLDNRVITIPNGELANSTVTNNTANETRRLDLTFTIDYGADIRLAREVLEKAFREHPDIDREREINVFVDSLADSAVVMGVYGWVPAPKYLVTKRELTEEIKLRLDEAGVKIPFPQLDVHFDNIKS